MSARVGVFALIVLSIPIIFWGLGSYSVANNDEAYYHAVAAAYEAAYGGSYYFKS